MCQSDSATIQGRHIPGDLQRQTDRVVRGDYRSPYRMHAADDLPACGGLAHAGIKWVAVL
ncbi:hypothetical protein DPMN_107187 [Dreissena polymorpha]|uniref:Uncharacterized protein n=1 Tax=Dreissena polymorpha TaxID=45954 RepID=A0A9D4K6D5_DREPO|nr:hypothetical protein DPMN_107187 [Dreissena polymorpha]